MDYGRKRDVLRELTVNEYNSRPKVKYSDSFASTSSPDERESMALILKTAEKYQPYMKKK